MRLLPAPRGRPINPLVARPVNARFRRIITRRLWLRPRITWIAGTKCPASWLTLCPAAMILSVRYSLRLHLCYPRAYRRHDQQRSVRQSNWQSPWIFPVPSNLSLLLLDSFSRLTDARPSLSHLLINSRRGLAAARFIPFRRKSSHAQGFVVRTFIFFVHRRGFRHGLRHRSRHCP